MLSFCNVSPAQAEHYYQKDDYYTQEEATQTPSYWTGKGATTLGLEGAVDPETFVDLLHGLAPDNTFLLGRWVDPEKHRAATDYTFSAPKSVSIAALVQEDDRVLVAHTKAVETALSVLEKRYAQTRISTDKGRQRITTGNLIAAVFPHDTSRELEPQLHSHCVVINATQLPDGQWRSFSNEEVVQNQKLLGQIYQNELAYELKQVGYEIGYRSHGQFEIAGYSSELLSEFSTRRHQIEELIKTWESERIPILDGNGNPIASTKARYEAATLRSRKTKPPAVSRDKLQRGWSAFLQLKGIELPDLPGYELDHSPEQLTLALDTPPLTAEMVLESSINHCSERESVFRQTKIERFIFENHLGERKFSELETAIAQSSDLIQVDKQRYTTQSALHLELNTIRLMQQGQGTMAAIAPDSEIQSYLENKNLTDGQRAAVQLAIATRDQVIAIQGVAGAGKSYALDSVRAIAQSHGYEVKGYAPSAEAASVLGEAIGIQTETISRHLVTQNHNDTEQTQPQLWIVDEAGLLSMRQAHDLLQKAQSENARVILVGDRRQLSAVEAGNPFKSLQAGGIATARLDESLRQKTQDLRIAVKAIAQGNVSAGVQLLDQAGCIVEANPDKPGDRLSQLVRDYINLSPEEREKTLLLAGTNRDRLDLTQQIRTAMQAEDSLGQNHLNITGLRTKDMTTAQSQYVHSYEMGDVIVPHQEYKKQQLGKNQQYRVVNKDRENNRLTLASADGHEFEIDPSHCPKKSVYQSQELEVAVGDRLRWSKNDTSAGIRNGQTFTVLGFEDQQTQIQYADGKTDRVNLNGTCYVDYAWVSTTYSAQGKTADRVLAATDRTLNQESFYVICSRAKYQLTLYTDNKTELIRQAQISRNKENVSDYVNLLEANEKVAISAGNTAILEGEELAQKSPHFAQNGPDWPARSLVSHEQGESIETNPDLLIANDHFFAQNGPDWPTLGNASELTDLTIDSRREEQEPSLEPIVSESSSPDLLSGTSHDAIPTFDPERLRSWLTERIRAFTTPAPESRVSTPEPTATDFPTSPTESELTAAISRLDFSAPAPASATDDLGTETGWDEQTDSEQSPPNEIDRQSTGCDSTLKPGGKTLADAGGDRPVDAVPESASGTAEQPSREPTIADRLTEFAERIQREVAAYGNRSDAVEPTIQPAEPEERTEFGTPEPSEWNSGVDRARDEIAESEDTPAPVLAIETGLGGEGLHVSGVDSVDRDRGDLRDRLRLDTEPISAGDADAHQWAGEQYREATGENRETAGVEAVKEQQVEPVALEQQQEWAEIAYRTMAKLLNTLEVTRHEGQRYIAQYDGENRVLTIDAKDGRGEIFRSEEKRVVKSALKGEDIQVFEQLDERVEEQRRVQRQMEWQQARERSRGFEME
jgi:conjugative relaxase-like TrwC/TraI family protein